MSVAGRFTANDKVADGTLVVVELDASLVWAGQATAVPTEVLEHDGPVRHLLVHPDYLARMDAALKTRGFGSECLHTRVHVQRTKIGRDIETTQHCADCGEEL